MPTSFTNLNYHIIFSTKRREPLITPRIQPELYRWIGGIIRDERGTLLAVGGMPDHIHLVATFPADRSVAEMLRRIKSNSSKWANERQAGGQRFGWQAGYGAFSVSESRLEAVIEYVKNQEAHHQGMTFQEEFMKFLRRHGISFKEEFLWD